MNKELIEEFRKAFNIEQKEKKEKIKRRDFRKLQTKYNTLEIKYENLKKEVQEGFYQKYLEQMDKPLIIARLRKENKMLKAENKELKRKEK